MTRLTLVFLHLALAGCSAATNQSYEGPPLAVIKGTMTAKEGLIINSPVRLAIAWFSYFSPGEAPGVPKGLITDELAYTGTFPQAYTFTLNGLPPAESIGNAPGFRGAVGALIAYEDLDGDGQLTVSPSGPVTDRVLGSSAPGLAFPLRPQEQSTYVVFLEAFTGERPPGASTGYNLISSVAADDGGVSQNWKALSSSQLPLALTGEPELNLLACGEHFTRLLTGTIFGACGITPTDVVEVNASLRLSGTASFAVVYIFGASPDGGFTIHPNSGDAGVTINGQSLAWDSNIGQFLLYEATPKVVVPDGPNVVRVNFPGQPIWEGTGLIPPPFTLTAPATARVGSTFTVSWVRRPGDTSQFFAGSMVADPIKDSAEFTAPTQPGPFPVTVIASTPFFPTPKVSCSRSVTVTVDVKP